MCSKVKGSAQSYFSSLESTTRRGSDEIHQSFVLPWGLHSAAVEIAFREGNMLKNLITIAIGKMVGTAYCTLVAETAKMRTADVRYEY